MERIAIIQGEYVVAARPDVLITTLLGSCIAVCLHDPQAHIGGMNHFLLGEPEKGQQIRPEDMHRYGVHAMELLINAMMRAGAMRSRLRAQVFGGGNVVAAFGAIGSTNGAFALRFLAEENIPVLATDIGGTRARKVQFMAWEGIARCEAVRDDTSRPLMPANFAARFAASQGDVEFFEPPPRSDASRLSHQQPG